MAMIPSIILALAVLALVFAYVMDKVLDGRNAHLADGVQRALGRQPKDFAAFARDAAAAGAWAHR